jgi:hypothetical protein
MGIETKIRHYVIKFMNCGTSLNKTMPSNKRMLSDAGKAGATDAGCYVFLQN